MVTEPTPLQDRKTMQTRDVFMNLSVYFLSVRSLSPDVFACFQTITAGWQELLLNLHQTSIFILSHRLRHIMVLFVCTQDEGSSSDQQKHLPVWTMHLERNTLVISETSEAEVCITLHQQ